MAEHPRAYLDHAATAMIRPEVVACMASVMSAVGNPSSVHGNGRAARRVLEDARAVLAAATGAQMDDITFTSGGTEANDLALGAAGNGPVLVSAVEHASVLDAAPLAARIMVGPDGVIDLAGLDELLGRMRPSLVSVMLVNNETGVIQPIREIARRCRHAGALLHVDAVQAFGKLVDARLDWLDCDLLTVSAHKIGGPPGVGALVTRPGVVVAARLRGGGQEGRRRAGTPNLPGIAGFAQAIRQFDAAEPARQEALRADLEARIAACCPGTRIAGQDAPRAPHVTCLVTPGRPAEMQVIRLDLAGVAVSAGAACSSGKVSASHVLAAMGMGPDAGCGIRVSLGWTTTAQDIDRFVTVFAEIMDVPSKMSNKGRSPLPNAPAIAT